jgi:hypothetical protein
MTEQALWIVIGFLVVVVVGAAIAAFRFWRKSQDEDERAAFIFDTIDKLLSSLVTETKQELAKIPLEDVSEAARAVWAKVIQPTPLVKLIPEDTFVDLVRREWEKAVSVDIAVVRAVQFTQAARLTARASGPPGRV